MIDRKERRILIGASAAWLVANATLWLQPVLMRMFVAGNGWADSAAGMLISAEVAALACASAWSTRLFARRSSLVPVMVGGILVAMAATLLSIPLQQNYQWLLLVRVIAGLGEGVVLMVGNVVAARSIAPEGMFARMNIINVLSGVALMNAVPMVTRVAGESAAAFGLMALTFLLALPFVAWMPRADGTRINEPMHVSTGVSEPSRMRIGLIAVALFAVTACSGIVWVYYALIGEAAGLTADEVSAAIGIAIFAAGVSSLLAAMLGVRFGRVIPVAGGLLVMTASILVLSRHPSAGAFRVAACLQMGSLYFLVPYFMGVASAEDAEGKGAAYAGSALFMATAVSPVIGGLLVEHAGFGMVGVGVALVAMGAALVFAYLERRQAAVAARA